MKKLFSILLVAIMVLGSFSAVFAGSITVTPAEGDNGDHTYTAYQILTGDITKENGGYVYANAEWGTGVTPDADGKVEIGGKKYTAAEFAAAFKEGELSEADAAAFEAVVTNGTDSDNNKIDNLANGYYLVKDTKELTGQKDENDEPVVAAKTRYILVNVLNEDRPVDSKSSVPSVEKKVKDVNDSVANSETGWQDSADYDIGDTIPYQVTATIGDGIANFTAYSFQFVDRMSKGLTLVENSWDIKVGEKSIKDLFTLTSAAGENGATVWTWAATDIKPEIADKSKVVLTYNCELNEEAVIGAPGNPNDVKLKFDNNPNNCGNGTPEGETPEDRNKVFTYETIVDKVNEKKDPLVGASFKLEKKLADGTTKTIKEFDVEDASSFTFTGLDDGDYVLTETKTPTGYNSVEPIEFTISAEHDETSADPQLIDLKGTEAKEVKIPKGQVIYEVINQKGAVLPETGGMGTTILYTLGGLLVVGAGVLLVARRKMNDR